MGWEISLTLAFIGGAAVVTFIGYCLKDDEFGLAELTNLKWLPVGLRTFFYFLAFGMVMMAVGVQSPIMVQNQVYVNETDMNATTLLGNAVTGGVAMTTNIFYSSIVIIMIICILLILYKTLLSKKKGDYEEGRGGDYDKY